MPMIFACVLAAMTGGKARSSRLDCVEGALVNRRTLRALLPGIVLLTVNPCGAQQAGEHSVASPLEQLSGCLQAVVQKASPSIVEIEVLGYTRSERDEEDGEDSPRAQHGSHILTKTHSIGSGVILDPDGYIITNAHVLEGARRVRVTLDEKVRSSHAQLVGSRVRTSFDAKIIGSFEEVDLAVVKIDAHNLPTIPIAESESIQPGQLVFALGNPEGFTNSVSIGVVSAIGRVSETNDAATYIQTDAAINAGSSGGALVDVKGNLIGITSFMITEGGGSEGLGFALPSRLVYSVFQALKNTGHVDHGDVGIRVQNVTPELAAGLQLTHDWGIIVSDVDPGSSAASAGVQVQDIILTLDGSSISSSPQFEAALYHKKPGDHVTLSLLRGQRRFSVDMPVLERDHFSEKPLERDSVDGTLVPRLGILCARVSEGDHPIHPVFRSHSGVTVVAQFANSDTKNDLASGDIIQSVNGTEVIDVDTLRALTDKLDPGSTVVLRIERQKHFKYLTIEIE